MSKRMFPNVCRAHGEYLTNRCSDCKSMDNTKAMRRKLVKDLTHFMDEQFGYKILREALKHVADRLIKKGWRKI